MIGGRGCCTGFGHASLSGDHSRWISSSCRSSSSKRLPVGGKGEAVGLVLGLVPAGADPELDPAAGDVVDRDDVLRQHRGRPERDRRDHRPEPDPLGHRGERGQRRPGVERARGRAAEDGEVVVGAEQPLEADALGGAGERAPLLPGDALLSLDHQAETHSRNLSIGRSS